MVRAPELRIRKFDAKVQHPVVSARITALRDMMIEQETAKFTELESLEKTVSPVLSDAGVDTRLFPFYYSYARKLYKVSKISTGGTLDIEVQIVYETWKARGLNAVVLQDIAKVLGLTIPRP